MKCILSSVVAVLVFAAAARADLIAYESFSQLEITDSIVGQESGVGFVGQWKSWGGAPNQTNLKISEGSLSFPGLPTAGNSVTGGALNGNWVGLVHDLESRSDETTTKYLSFLIRPEGFVDQAFGIMLDGTGPSGDIAIGKSPNSGGRYMIETFYNTATQSSNVLVESGVTSFMVVKAELAQGADTFTLYVNPPLGEPEPTTGTVKRGHDIGQVKGIGIGANGHISVDELRWGDSFAAVTPLSSPAILTGDFDEDGQLAVADIDLLSSALGSQDIGFDLDGNGTVDREDHRIWVEDIFGTFFGDADLNKEVEFADFLALSAAFGGEGGWTNGDFDGNGNVVFPDFLALSANFGKGAAGVAAAVPEPTAACLGMFAILGLTGFRRRR